MLPVLDISVDVKVPPHPFSTRPCPGAATGEGMCGSPGGEGPAESPLSAESWGNLSVTSRCGRLWAAVGRLQEGLQGGLGKGEGPEPNCRGQLQRSADPSGGFI